MNRWARWLAPAFVGAAAFVLTMTAGTARTLTLTPSTFGTTAEMFET